MVEVLIGLGEIRYEVGRSSVKVLIGWGDVRYSLINRGSWVGGVDWL